MVKNEEIDVAGHNNRKKVESSKFDWSSWLDFEQMCLYSEEGVDQQEDEEIVDVGNMTDGIKVIRDEEGIKL